jgi:hypothetical protein
VIKHGERLQYNQGQKKNIGYKSSFLIAHVIHPMARKEQASKRETPQEKGVSLVCVVFIA